LKERLTSASIKRNSLILITLVTLSGYLFIPRVFANEDVYTNISVKSAYKMLKSHSDILLLDVRSDYEYSVSHLYDALHFYYEEIGDRISEIEQYKEMNLVIYCKSGLKSKEASTLLVNYGFLNVYNIEGGILAWLEAGFPIWTTSHEVTVEEHGKVEISPRVIETYDCGCECTNENNNPNLFEEIDYEIVQESLNNKEIAMTYKIDDKFYETSIKISTLFSLESESKGIKRYYEIISYEISTDDNIRKFYIIKSSVIHKEYSLSISTMLTYSNLDYYDKSDNLVIFTSEGKSDTLTLELININKMITLSQQYKIIGKIAKKLANVYKKSEDIELRSFFHNYRIISKQLNDLSQFVREYHNDYDKLILESAATIIDPSVAPPPIDGGGGGDDGGDDGSWGDDVTCIACKIAFDAALLGGCLLGCLIWPPFCVCVGMVGVVFWALINQGVAYVCHWMGAC
jgi:rhodanese-related sulfurtransferase